MFDPIPQKDYYSLHGIFASSAEPKDNPIISAQADAKLYQDYLKARDEAAQGAKKFISEEFEKTRVLFRQHAGDLLMCGKALGLDRRKYIEAIGQPAKVVEEYAQMIRRGGGGAMPRRNPILYPFIRFSELPADKFAEKAPALCAEIGANADKRFPINPILAAAFRGKSPKSLDDVATIYNDLFKSLDKKASETPATPVPALAGGISAPSNNPSLEELMQAPFGHDPMKDFDADEVGKMLPQRIGQKYLQLMAAVTQMEMTHPGAPKRAMVLEDTPEAEDSPVFIRGEADKQRRDRAPPLSRDSRRSQSPGVSRKGAGVWSWRRRSPRARIHLLRA